MNAVPTSQSDAMECPLCLGRGQLRRAEILDRLGVKDLARVAQLSAEEAFRLLQQKHTHDDQGSWVRFESELAKRTTELKQEQAEEIQVLLVRLKELELISEASQQQHEAEVSRIRSELEQTLRLEQSQKEDLNRRVEDYFREISALRERNQQLELQMQKVARVGRREEQEFAEEARCWPGIWVSDKLGRNGDYLMAFRAASGAPIEPQILVDNKDKAAIAQNDIDKLVRDAKQRSLLIAALVSREESQLRVIDKENRWSCEDGVWVLRTTRQWFPRDLDVLKPVLERMRKDGPESLQRHLALAGEVRRTLCDLDEIDKEIGKAAKSITVVGRLVGKHKEQLQRLCGNHCSESVSVFAPGAKTSPTLGRENGPDF